MRQSLIDILVCPYTRSPLKLDIFERQDDQIEYGVLQGEADRYPIIAGIPILLPKQDSLIDLLRAGHYKAAVVRAAFGSPPAQGPWHITKWFQDTTRLRRLGASLEAPRHTKWVGRIADELFPAHATPPGPRRLFELAYRELQLRVPEVFNYFWYRYGMPRHLVALAFVQAIGPQHGPVLDLACGAGHLTWALQRRVAPHSCIGLDNVFFSLYVARKHIAPEADFVCGDINNLPFQDSVFSLTFCSDAFFNFQTKWNSLREIERILDATGKIMLVWLRNKLVKHLYPGRPLTPAGYRQLVAHLPHVLIPDSLVLERYLQGNGLPGYEQVDSDMLNGAATVSIIASKQECDFGEQPAFATWPHADGLLRVNPLFVSNDASMSDYIRRFPSQFYADENVDIIQYLPSGFSLSAEQRKMLEAQRVDGLEDLIRNCSVLGFPPGYFA
jgi:SAM-dependent methyltransferase/uncharacterized protein YbaR (Trm112 family)